MSKSKIINYKTRLDIIHVHTLRDGAKISKQEIDFFMKVDAQVSESCSGMPEHELNDLLEYTHFLAFQIGCELKEPGSEFLDLNFNRCPSEKN